MNLILHSSDETVIFAAEELKDGLKKAGLSDVRLYPATFGSFPSPALHLGVKDEDFFKESLVAADPVEDAFEINVSAGRGFLCGANPRSVLFSVYAFLRHLGFEWLNPKTETFRPSHPVTEDGLSLSLFKVAANRHRGVVLEGAVSLTHCTDMINWLPKLYFNSYFIQFKLPYHFFVNWYGHTENPLLSSTPVSEANVLKMKHVLECELKKRGLLHHAVGHAWTCESIGVKGLSWDRTEIRLTERQKEKVALIRGKRELYEGITLNTNLCYENEEALSAFTEEVVGYLKAEKDIDYLHIWLADGFNNFCECPLCKDRLPSDQYVALLNRLDAALTKEGISTKLVFLIYFDLLFAPKTERLQNPDRFVMMFAPLTRTFEKSYKDMGEIPPCKEYVKNKIRLPHSIEENLSYLIDWQKGFSGDSFVFDYPLGRSHYGDPGYVKISRVLFQDIRSLKKLGLSGYLSCQEQRSFFPTGLPNFVMGLALFDEDVTFEELSSLYFERSFGPYGERVLKLLDRISETFSMDHWNHSIPRRQAAYAERLKSVLPLAKNLSELVKEGNDGSEPWILLSYLPEYLKEFAMALSRKASGEDTLAAEHFRKFSRFVQENEYNLAPYLDVFRLLSLSRNNAELGMQSEDDLLLFC